MLKTDVLFVIGAAVSAELGLPMGEGLKKKIVGLLPAGRSGGDDEMRHYAESYGLMRECITLKTALPLAASIDNLIEHRSDNEGLVKIAKVAIAFAISEAEVACAIGGTRSSLSDLPADGSYAALFRLIVGGVPKPQLEDAFARLRVITFNYDRTLEVFLLRAIMAYANLSTDEAQQVLSRATIIHAYGALGASGGGLSWGVTAFERRPPIQHIAHDAGGLRTFSEKLEDGSDQPMRDLVAASKQIVFLGCAYHRQNMSLLEAPSDNFSKIAGTAYFPPPKDPQGHATPSLESFAGPIQDSVKSIMNGWYRPKSPVPLDVRARFDILPMTSLQLITFLGSRWTE